MEEFNIKMENEEDILPFQYDNETLLHSDNADWKESLVGYNITEEYFTVKEEPLISNPEPIVQKPSRAMVYTTKIDDMSFMTRRIECYNKMLKRIEKQSKPRYKPGCIISKRLPSSSKYYSMLKKIQFALKRKKAEKQWFLDRYKTLLDVCRPVSVVIKRLDLSQISSDPSNILTFDVNKVCSHFGIDLVPSHGIKEEQRGEKPENNMEIIEIDEDEPMQFTSTNTSRNPSDFKLHCYRFLFVQDAYFNKTVICGVNNRGHTVFYLDSSSELKSTILNSIGVSSIIALKSCCWYKSFEQLNQGWCIYFHHNNSETVFDPFIKTPPFVLRSHQCRPITCGCCCKNKYKKHEINNVLIMNSKNELSTQVSKSNTDNKESFSSTVRRYLIGIAKTSSSFVRNQLKSLNSLNQKTVMLCFKNIESYQGEFYYFYADGTLASYYILWYKASFPLISKLVSGCTNDNIVCCWAKREQAVAFFLAKYRTVSPTVLRFIKRFHACAFQNCKCCCMHELKKPLKKQFLNLKLDLPKIRKHTIQHRVIKKKLFDITKTQEYKEIQPNQSSTLPFLLVGDNSISGIVQVPQFAAVPFAIASTSINKMPAALSATSLSANSHLVLNPSNSLCFTQPQAEPHQTVNATPENTIKTERVAKNKNKGKKYKNKILTPEDSESLEQQSSICINILPESLKDSVLTVDENRKVAATLPVPAVSLCTESLKILSNILKKAQEQIDTLSLPPGTKLNLNVPITITPTPDKPVSPFIPVSTTPTKQDNIKYEQFELLKSFTATAVLKSQYYKKCFYQKNNEKIMKATETEPLIKSVSTLSMEKTQQITAVPGPSGIVKNIKTQVAKEPIQFQPEIVQFQPEIAKIAYLNNESVLRTAPTKTDTIEMATITANNSPELSQFHMNEKIYTEESEFDNQDLDDYCVSVYDEDDQEIEMKPVIHDDITIEENTLFAESGSASEAENNECILGA